MVDYSDVFIGLDVSKDSHAVAVAQGGRDGEVRYFGEIASDAAAVRRFVRKLERPDVRLRFCYEAGPTGYGLERLIEGLGHDCAVIAPARRCSPSPMIELEKPTNLLALEMGVGRSSRRRCRS